MYYPMRWQEALIAGTDVAFAAPHHSGSHMVHAVAKPGTVKARGTVLDMGARRCCWISIPPSSPRVLAIALLLVVSLQSVMTSGSCQLNDHACQIPFFCRILTPFK